MALERAAAVAEAVKLKRAARASVSVAATAVDAARPLAPAAAPTS